ncbi:MAG TPA: Ger(x)C family spore germination protein [Thermoanaerobacterales bacterium]|nr:Ger(x)C family spore germination protein [Thermoanaerobacterales bacterium]
MIKSSSATSMAVQVNINEFLKNLASPTSDPIACRIEMIQDHQNKNQKMRLTGASVFRKDKLVGFLDEHETRGLNWILGKVVSGIILVKSPKDENEDVALEIIRASSKIIPEISDDQIKITIEIKEEGNLAEQLPDIDLTNTKTFKELEQRKAQVIKNEVQSVLEKAQKEWGADIFGFGDAVHRKYPKEWKTLQTKWRDVFPTINVEIKVDARLRDTGLSSAPVKGR